MSRYAGKLSHILGGIAHAHSTFRQSKQSHGQPASAGQGDGKPQVLLMAVLNRRYLPSMDYGGRVGRYELFIASMSLSFLTWVPLE